MLEYPDTFEPFFFDACVAIRKSCSTFICVFAILENVHDQYQMLPLYQPRPVVTVACLIVFLGEDSSVTNVIGGCLIFGALLAVSCSQRTITNPSVGFRQERAKRKTLEGLKVLCGNVISECGGNPKNDIRQTITCGRCVRDARVFAPPAGLLLPALGH